MRTLRSAAATCLLVLSLSAGLYGCGAPEPPTPTPTVGPPTATPAPPTATPIPPSPTTPPTPTAANTPTATPTGMLITGPAADLMLKSSQAMKGVTSYHFTIQNTVKGVAGNQAIKGEGDFEAPDKRRVAMQITPQGTTEIVTIGSDMYFKMPGSEAYTLLGGPANPMGSLGAAGTTQDTTSIALATESAEILGDEQVEGVDTTHIKFTYDVDKAVSVSAQSGSPASTPVAGNLGKANGEMWIEKGTGFVRKLSIASAVPDTAAGGTPAPEGTSVVEVVFSKYNEPVTPPIERPANATAPDGSPLGPPTTPGP